MASFASPAPSPPATPLRRRTKTCARRCERACCAVATYFPLAFVYSLTTWAVFVEAGLGLKDASAGKTKSWAAKPTSILGIVLYLLLNTCYTVAVFTDPGSPLKESPSSRNAQYSSLPTTEPSHDYGHVQPITVSSTGSARYCKKCQTPKPDRTHHCSTCRRCVLKMDHHCPWLATCLGLHNYKAFVLFLIYVCVFCWLCFLSTAWWVWTEVFESNQYMEEFAPINIILLAVISGIIGLVMTGFTSWHLYLCSRGQTTIECLEKTRYLSGVRRQVERQRQDQLQGHNRTASQTVGETLQRAGEQILEFHANAVPGASRFEEGEEHTSPIPSIHQSPRPLAQTETYSDSPAQQALRRTYSSIEDQRERDRYDEYMDDKESQKLPNAFDLGWKRNFGHLFGPKPLFWFLPVCNTTGDGWRWEVSQKWIDANEEAAIRRDQRSHDPRTGNGVHLRGGGASAGYEGANDVEHRTDNVYSQSAMSMQTMKRPPGRHTKRRREFDENENGELDHYEVSSDSDAGTDDAWQDQERGEVRTARTRRGNEDEWREWD